MIFRNLPELRKISKLIRSLLLGRVVFIFQMGKVGSISLKHAIQRYKQDKYLLFVHDHRVFIRDYFLIGQRNNRLKIFIVLWCAKLGFPIKIVTSIREPIARNVSAFFYFYCVNIPYLHKKPLGEIVELFLTDSRPRNLRGPRKLPVQSRVAECLFTLNWFDQFFRPVTGIDVYKKPFPIDRKWQVYKKGGLKVLLYRNDLELSQQTELISRFLGIELDEIKRENHTKDLDYAELYSRFRESVKLPEPYIRRVHDSRFARHFWHPEELEAAADKWRGDSRDPTQS